MSMGNRIPTFRGYEGLIDPIELGRWGNYFFSKLWVPITCSGCIISWKKGILS